MKKISIIHLFLVSLVLVFGSNVVHTFATRPSGTYPNGQMASPFLSNGSNAQARVGALAIGTTNSPTTGTMFDIVGTLFTNGLIVPANTVVTYNIDTSNVVISKLAGTSTQNRELCANPSGTLIVCP